MSLRESLSVDLVLNAAEWPVGSLFSDALSVLLCVFSVVTHKDTL